MDGAEQDLQDPVSEVPFASSATAVIRESSTIFIVSKRDMEEEWSRLRFITVGGTDFRVRQMEIWLLCRNRP